MNLLSLFAMLLLVTQARLPATGETINSGSNGDYKPQTGTNSGYKPSPPTLPAITPEDRDGPNLKTSSSKDHSSDNQAVESTPPVWRYREWVAFYANLTLVVVGILGVGAAYFTLTKIERQTDAAEEATKVAKANMDALISKERARVRVDPPVNDLSFLVPGYRRKVKGEFVPFTEDHAIEVFVFNRGGTTARDVKASFGISISSVSIEGGNPIQNTEKVFMGDLAASSEPFKHKITLYGGIKQEDLEDIHEQRAVLRVFGEITYIDAFDSQKTRTTAFGFEWKSDAEWHENRSIRAVSADSSGWYVYPPDANKTT